MTEGQLDKQKNDLAEVWFNSSPMGIFIVQGGKFQFVNPQFQTDTGYGKEELVGMDSLSLVLPEDRDQVREKMVQMLRGERSSPHEYRFLTKSGETRWVIGTMAPVRHQGRRVALGYCIDVTERKRVEEVLRHSQKLEVVGELAAGMAHEVNNPLTIILGRAQLLSQQALPDSVRRDLSTICEEAERAAKVIRDLLSFARRRQSERRPVDVVQTLTRVLALKSYDLRAGRIQVEVDFAPDIPPVMADEHQLQQVFLNVLTNAHQAMVEAHGEGRLAVRGGRVGNNARVTLADSGPGIPEEHLGLVFQPFFTTKGEGKGTGLGLSISHRIVADHGGRIWAESAPGKGAAFHIELPGLSTPAEGGGPMQL